MVLEKNGSGSSLTVKDKKNDTANNYSLDVNTQSDGEFNFFFKVENLKLLDGTYDVEVSSKNISHYKNKNSEIEYWIALEPEINLQSLSLGVYIMEDFLWVEKYRPNTIRDCILPDELKKTFGLFVQDKHIPNMILSGGFRRW